MSQEEALVAIDVGTTKVCTLVGSRGPGGDVRLLGYGLARAQGLHKGVVVDFERSHEAIYASVLEAQRSSGIYLTSAYIGIAGAQAISTTTYSGAPLNDSRPITARDLRRVRAAAVPPPGTAAGEVLHIIPLSYSVDGHPSIGEPLGMHGLRLDAETHVISTTPGPLRNLRQAVEAAGIRVEGLVLKPIASGEAVLSEEEKEAGVAVVDMGGGTTGIAVFRGGRAVHTAILPVAGYQITNDIAIGLTTPFVTAENLKLSHGAIFPNGSRKPLQVPTFGVQESRSVSPVEICLLIRERIAELFHIMLQRLREAGNLYRLPAGLVLTGGTASLPGLDRLAQEVLGLPVRVGLPAEVQGLPKALTGPAFATAVGILLWSSMGEPGRDHSASNGHHRLANLHGRLGDWLRSFFMLP